MSAAKRSRTCRSPSFGDAGGLNQILPSSDPGNPLLYVRTAIRNGGKAMKPSPEAERNPPSVLTMSTPEVVCTGRAAQVDDFLDQCYFCRRRIPHNEDVYMCGPFRAFCSPECRDQQVEFDTIAEDLKKEAPVQPARTMYSTSNNVNGS